MKKGLLNTTSRSAQMVWEAMVINRHPAYFACPQITSISTSRNLANYYRKLLAQMRDLLLPSLEVGM
jgi:hypothetical protein